MRWGGGIEAPRPALQDNNAERLNTKCLLVGRECDGVASTATEEEEEEEDVGENFTFFFLHVVLYGVPGGRGDFLALYLKLGTCDVVVVVMVALLAFMGTFSVSPLPQGVGGDGSESGSGSGGGTVY